MAEPELKTQTQAQPRVFIRRVEVEDLFGSFTYEIEARTFDASEPNLVILYGDNGSGKTTLLRLIFHLLSPEPNGGHRTFVVNTPFQRFEVELGDGTLVSAERPPRQI